MGVLEPLEEAVDEGVPATPPDLETEDSGDDLFAETETKQIQKKGIFNFDKFITTLMPSKVVYDDPLDFELKKTSNEYLSEIQTSPKQQKKKKNFCSRCFEEMKKDLKKLAKVVENFKNERDAARAENESLKKEVEELKRILKEKEEKEKSEVRVIIDNKDKTVETVDVSVRRKNFQNARSVFNKHVTEKDSVDSAKQSFGISAFSISLQEQEKPSAVVQPKIKKTNAELRREFFAQEFESEQKSFTARNYLVIKPEEKKETERSRLTIDVKPKQKINEIISKLTSQFGGSKVIPAFAPITLFQRFEKTRDVWVNGLEERCA